MSTGAAEHLTPGEPAIRILGELRKSVGSGSKHSNVVYKPSNAGKNHFNVKLTPSNVAKNRFNARNEAFNAGYKPF